MSLRFNWKEQPLNPDCLIPAEFQEIKWPEIPEGMTQLRIKQCFQEDMYGKYTGQKKITLNLITASGMKLDKVFYSNGQGFNFFWLLFRILGTEPNEPFLLSELVGIEFEACVGYRFTANGKLIIDLSCIKPLSK